MAVLGRYSSPSTAWVETGGDLGVVTKFLARNSKCVHSIDADLGLARKAKHKLRLFKNVEIHAGTSERLFESARALTDTDVSFWLDGRFSGPGTFEGLTHTLVMAEVNVIFDNLAQIKIIRVFIDDYRCFEPESEEFTDYPARAILVSWAVENGFWWTVEHDIFIAIRNVISGLSEIGLKLSLGERGS